MLKSFRWVLLSAASSLCAQTPSVAPPADEAANGPDGPAVHSLWDISNTVRGSVGWRENVTVSSVHPINRAFWRAEAESFVFRPMGEHWRLVSFLSGDVIRYFSAATETPPVLADNPRNRRGEPTATSTRIPGEQQWAAAVEERWAPAPVFRATLKGVGFLQDVFIDPSETEGGAQPATQVRVMGGYVNFTPRVSLPAGFAVEPSFQVKRIDYKFNYNGDYNASRPGVRLEWKHTDRFVLSAGWYDQRRHYSHLPANAEGGRFTPERLLALGQREMEVKASSSFTARGTWTIAATAGWLRNRDRAVGYLDYDQQRYDLDLSWEGERWRVSLNGESRRQDYLHQSVNFGASARIAEDYDVTARIERDLTAKWTVFAENRWERNRSNIRDERYRFSYRTDTALVGLQRTF